MRILRLRAYFEPEQMAASHLDNDLTCAIVDNDFVYVNYTPLPTRGVSEQIYKEYKKKKEKTEHYHSGHMIVTRFPMFREGKNPVQRAVRYLACSIIEYKLGIKTKNVDLVFSSSTPPTQGMLSALVAKKLSKRYGEKVPFVFNLQDIFPDSLVNAGITKKGSLVWRIGRKIEDYTYRKADKIIVISEGFKKNLMDKGVLEDKISIIPNWVDTNNVYPVERKNNSLFDKLDLSRDKFYICYSGNIGHSQNLNLLVEVARDLEKTMPDVYIVMIGEGAAKEELAKLVKQYDLQNVKMFPFQPYQDIANVFSLGDVGLIISKPGIGASSVPSKTWSIMAAEKPVLASFDLNSEVSELITRLGCGKVAEAGDKQSMIDAIKCLYHADRKQIGKMGRQYVTTELDSHRCTAMYVDILKDVGNKC